MLNFMRKIRGSVSILLILILLPMTVATGLFVDGARIKTAQTTVSGAGDLALNAALSEYDQTLYDMYGLLAVSQDMSELQDSVLRYFDNSLGNTEVLNDSDSYTRGFLNNMFGSKAYSDTNFSKLITVTVDDFELSGVNGSALANPRVLERQIVDYMKYRGPVNIGKGLLTKLGCLGEVKKQTDAINAKIKYDKQLNKVQEACQNAYDEITTYKNLLESSSFIASDYKDKITGDIASAKSYTEKMSCYILADKNSAYKVDSLYATSPGYTDITNVKIKDQELSVFSLDGSLKSTIEGWYSNSDAESEDGKYEAALDKIEEYLVTINTVKLNANSDGTYSADGNVDFMKKLNGLKNYYVKNDSDYSQELKDQIQEINGYNAITNIKKCFTYIVMYNYYFGKLTDEADDLETFKAKNEEYLKVGVKILACSEFCHNYGIKWKGFANSSGEKASESIYKWENEISTLVSALEKSIEKLDDLYEEVNKLDEPREKWGSKVEELSDSDIKTSMKGDYQNSAQDINEDALNELKGILETNKKHFNAISERLEGIKFQEKAVGFKDYSGADFESRYNAFLSNSTKPVEDAKDYISLSYVDKDLEGLDPDKYSDISNVQFYKYLVRMCGVSGEEDSDKKEESKKLKKDLTEAGNKGAKSEAPTLGSDVPAKISDALGEDVLSAIDELCGTESDDENNTLSDVSTDKDDDAAENNSSNLSNMSSFLSKLSEFGEMMRDDLYLEEYMTEMFSCLTDKAAKDADSSAVIKAMNGKDISGNKLFGAEAEYILWGKSNIQDNIKYTRAMIFGVRFLLNSIFAFTNSYTVTPASEAATAIAGWTGFGAPIVQTLILLAWSMAESTVDVSKLCSGENVALYKSKDTWYLGFGGLKQKLADGIEKVATFVVDDIFDKVESALTDASTDAINNLSDSLKAYADKTLTGVRESVVSAVNIPIEKLANRISNSSETLNETKITQMLEDTLNNLQGDGQGLVNECINAAVNSLISNSESEIAGQLMEIYNSSETGSAADVINEKVSNLCRGIENKIITSIEGKIDEYSNKFESEISDKISEGGEKLKENIKGKISEFTSGIAGDSSGTDSINKGGGTTAASGFTMSYKEYIKVFFMIRFMTNKKDNLLERTAQLIQINVSQKSSGFNIAEAYTVLQLSATADVGTAFFSVPVSSTAGDGSIVTELDYSQMGTGSKKVKYKSILGY